MPVYGAYTDFIACRFVALVLLAALAYRRRTGEGQYIDLSQYEASLHLLAPTLLDYTANGNLAERVGNGHAHFAPYRGLPVQRRGPLVRHYGDVGSGVAGLVRCTRPSRLDATTAVCHHGVSVATCQAASIVALKPGRAPCPPSR